MSDIQFGGGVVFAAQITIALRDGTGTAISGYVTPHVQNTRLMDDSPGVDKIRNSIGIVSQLLAAGDCILACTFDFVPRGTSKALAQTNARLPINPSAVSISGAPVIPVGQFLDGFNTDGAGGGNTQPWFYEGGGSVSGDNQTHWVSTFTLHRYFGITVATPVTA